VGRLYRGDAEDAERFGVVLLSDDVSDDDCIDDGTECDGYFVEPTESDTESAEDPKPDDYYCCPQVDAAYSGFHRNGQDEVE
jgi:hypothetical protein